MLRNPPAENLSLHTVPPILQLQSNEANTREQNPARPTEQSAQDRFRSLVLASSGLVWIADPKGKVEILESSKEAELLAGRDLNWLRGHGWLGIVHPEDRARVASEWERILAAKKPASTEYRVCGSSGLTAYIRVHSVPVLNPDGSVREWVGTCVNITEQKETENALRKSELRFRTLAQSSPVGIFLTDASGTTNYCNEALQRLTGLSETECLAMGWVKSIYDEDKNRVISSWRKYVGNPANTWKCVCRFVKADGKVIWVQSQVGPLRESDRILGFVGTVEDITDRKQAEDALRQSEARFSTIFRSSPVAISINTVEEGRFIEVNDQYCEFTGYSREELMGRSVVRLKLWANPEDRAPVINRLLKEGAVHNVETRYRRKSGELRDVLLSLELTEIAGESEPILIALINDITERKQAEEKLRRNEALLRIATRVGRMGAWAVDLPDLALTWSEEVRAIHEVPPDFIPSVEEALSFYTPEFQSSITDAFERCVRFGTPYDIEVQIITAKGRRVWVRAIGEAERNYYGIVRRVQGGFQDISEQKEAAEQTRQLADRLTTTLESITDAFVTLSHDWRFTYINKEAERLMQRPRNSLLGRSIWEEFKDTVGSTFEREYRRAVTENRTVEFEEYYPPFGLWLEVRAFPSEEGLAVYFRDITERRRAQESLRQSKERFQLLCKATNDAIWDWDLATNQIWWSDAFATVFGFEREELQGTVEIWSDRIHEQDRERVLKSLDHAIYSGQENWSDEYRFQRKNGVYAYVLDRGFIIRNSKGKPARMVGALTDITRRKEVEERLHENEQRLRNAQRIASLGSWDYDMVSGTLFWSDELYRIFGVPSEDFVPDYSGWFRYVHPEDEKMVEQFVESAVQNHKPIDYEHRIIRPDGQIRYVHERGEIIYDPVTGSPVRMSGTTQDITERKKLESKFLRAQRMESIGTLAGGIAHDLNNVLAPILMAVQILQDKVSDDEGHALLETLESCAKRGSDLIKQVLSFSRGVEGQRVIVNPVHLVGDIKKIIHETFPKNVECSFKAAREVWTITGDATQLHQVMMNLCVNGRDAMPYGGRLDISLENKVVDEIYAGMNPEAKPGNYVVLKVSDTGTGIPQTIREKIFEPFFTTKEPGRGTGLGLSTTIAIVRSHGGFISLESEVGQGSAFSVFLPANAGTQAAGAITSEPIELLRGKGEMILVVDDEETIRSVAQRALELAGYRVLLAAHGAEALALYAQHQDEVALVLTDMAMPVMDGISTIIALKKLNPNVKIIANSGYASGWDDARVMSAGVQHFLPKPYTAGTILKIIAQVLKGSA